jgi:hypothetical protein
MMQQNINGVCQDATGRHMQHSIVKISSTFAAMNSHFYPLQTSLSPFCTSQLSQLLVFKKH